MASPVGKRVAAHVWVQPRTEAQDARVALGASTLQTITITREQFDRLAELSRGIWAEEVSVRVVNGVLFADFGDAGRHLWCFVWTGNGWAS